MGEHIEFDDNGAVLERMLAQGVEITFVVSIPGASLTCGPETVRRSSSSSSSVVWPVTWPGTAREPVNSKASSSTQNFSVSDVTKCDRGQEKKKLYQVRKSRPGSYRRVYRNSVPEGAQI